MDDALQIFIIGFVKILYKPVSSIGRALCCFTKDVGSNPTWAILGYYVLSMLALAYRSDRDC